MPFQPTFCLSANFLPFSQPFALCLVQDRGLIPRVFQELFAQIKEKQLQQVDIMSCFPVILPTLIALPVHSIQFSMSCKLLC